MQIQVVSKGIDASEALRTRVTGRIEEAVAKYFNNRPGEAYVTVAKEGSGFQVDLSLHLPSGALLNTRGTGDEAYDAVDAALAKVEKRLRRYKRKLIDHRHGKDQNQTVPAGLMVLESRVDASDEDADTTMPNAADAENAAADPIIIAETTGQINVLTVGMAVRELDVTQSPFLMFRNAAHGALNVVYRRPDGHVGWIDPERQAAAKGAANG